VSALAAVVAANRYIALTTYRGDGTPVATAVWVADLGDGTVGFTTGASSGKVKRLTRNPAVRVSPCNARGVVAAGSPSWAGTARVARGADHARVRAAIARRYGWQLRLIDLAARIRRRPPDEVGVVVSFDDGG
jgi:PPOX class probable F420-dependent enzyme